MAFVKALLGTPSINADQNSGIDPNVDQFLSIPINADWQFLLMPDSLIRHWSSMFGIDQEAFRINAMIVSQRLVKSWSETKIWTLSVR